MTRKEKDAYVFKEGFKKFYKPEKFKNFKNNIALPKSRNQVVANIS